MRSSGRGLEIAADNRSRPIMGTSLYRDMFFSRGKISDFWVSTKTVMFLIGCT